MNSLVLLKNAFANVVRGSAAALVVILLPPFLTRILPSATYGTWILILQLSAYVGYFDFGIQTAVGRFIARANELNDSTQGSRIVSTASAMLAGASVFGLLLIFGLASQLPNLFHEMPPQLYTHARLTLILVGGSLALGLPFSVFNGVFIGLQRHEVPALIIGGSKLIGALFVILLAHLSGNIVAMGMALAIVNLISYVIQFIVCRNAASIIITPQFISRQVARELMAYCFSLSIWSLSFLLVSGLDTTIVGFFDYSSVATYAIAASLINFLQGLQSAIFLVLLPASAVLGTRNDVDTLSKLLVTSTRYGVFILLLSGLPLVFGAKSFLRLWVGEEYAASGAVILQVLTVANMIRLVGMPYANMLIGIGQQRLIILSPLAEGITNLVVGILVAARFGAVGVACGTLVGACISIGLHILYNMPRTTDIAVNRQIFLRDGILRPLLCAAPGILIGLILINLTDIPYGFSAPLEVAIFTITMLAVWYFGLMPIERQTITGIFSKG